VTYISTCGPDVATHAIMLGMPSGFLRDCARVVGKQESAGLNRHVVGDARALQERK